MIVIVDFGAGNTRSVLFALQRIGADACLTADAAELKEANGVILPGVGAFGRAMERLKRGNLDAALVDSVSTGKPLLGICLGYQLLFSESHEHGHHVGLGLIKGDVLSFGKGVKIPHMGWNSVEYRKSSCLFEGVENGTFFYFAHSFFVRPAEHAAALAVTDYGGEFVSSVQSGNVFGVQFHPEKSAGAGRVVLENFCRLCRVS